MKKKKIAVETMEQIIKNLSKKFKNLKFFKKRSTPNKKWRKVNRCNQSMKSKFEKIRRFKR